MIATLEGILSLLLPAAVVAGAKHTTDKLASLLVPTSKIRQRGPSFMKKLAVVGLVAVVLTLVGCGMNDHGHGNINGTWTAVLTGDENFTFGTSLVVNNDGTLSVSQFSFSTSGPCFLSGETASGSFGLTGDFNGKVTGTFTLNVVSGSPSGNTLMLAGTVNGNAIAGAWTLTGGSGCTGSGNFTMAKV